MAVSKAELKNIRALKTKKGRRLQGRLAVGGIRLLEEALRSGYLPQAVLFSNASLSDRAKTLLEQFAKRRIQVNSVSNKDLETISDTRTSQGVIGIFQSRDTKLSKLYRASYRRLLLCDGIADPGNLGTMARSALAFGFDMMLVGGRSVEVFNPKVVRSSAGAVFGLPIAVVNIDELKTFVKKSKAIVVAAEVKQKHESAESVMNLLKGRLQYEPVVLAVGSEAEGLSHEVKEMAEHYVTIKHSPRVESLNAAVAGSILMQEFSRIEISI